MALILCPGCALPRTASDAFAECPVCGFESVPAPAVPDDDDASALVLGPDIEPVSARPRSVASAKIPKATIGTKPAVMGPVRLAPGPAAVLDQMPPAPASAQVYMATAPVTAKIRRTSAPIPQLADEPISLAVAAPTPAPQAAPAFLHPTGPARQPDFSPAPVPALGHPPYFQQPLMIPVPAPSSPVPWVLAGLGLGAAAVAVVGWYMALSGSPAPTPVSPAATPERVIAQDNKPAIPPLDFDPNAREVLPPPRLILPSGEVADSRD